MWKHVGHIGLGASFPAICGKIVFFSKEVHVILASAEEQQEESATKTPFDLLFVSFVSNCDETNSNVIIMYVW